MPPTRAEGDPGGLFPAAKQPTRQAPANPYNHSHTEGVMPTKRTTIGSFIALNLGFMTAFILTFCASP